LTGPRGNATAPFVRRSARTVVATLSLAISTLASAQVSLQGHTDDVCFVAFMPDSTTLMSGSEDGSIRLWDAAAGRESRIWQKKSVFDASASSSHILSLSGDAKVLVRAGPAQGSVELWDFAKVARIRATKAHARPINGVVLSANGRTLITFTRDELKIWQAAPGLRQTMVVKIPSYSISDAAVTADGKLVAIATSDKAIGLYDAVAGKVVRRIDSGPEYVLAVAFSPDGTLLASAGEGSPRENLRIWNVSGGTSVGAIGPPDAAHSVTFSRDGRLLAAAGLSVTVFDVVTRTTAFAFVGHSGRVRSLSFSPDGHFLASGSEDNTVGVWDLTAKQPAAKKR
jgi:WD40 repeat protein